MNNVAGDPGLPAGQIIELAGRGRTHVRYIAGPPGAATVLLLHGWFVNADLNWFHSYEPLSEHYNVVALDHRGHGQGIRSSKRFSLEDAADDAAALLDLLGIDSCIAAGYSMGGPIAMNLWRRHPDRVQAMVLCATAPNFTPTRAEQTRFRLLGPIARATRRVPAAMTQRAFERLLDWRIGSIKFNPWMRKQILAGDPGIVLEAGYDLGRFNSCDWIGGIDPSTPVSVVVVTDDTMVPPARQRSLADSIPHAVTFQATGTHDTPVLHPSKFLPPFLSAVAHAAVSPAPFVS
ncbi:MAG: alpha/beta fold hydrolase [Acidimicrobiales bacterium]